MKEVRGTDGFRVLLHSLKLVMLKIKFSWDLDDVTGDNTAHIQLAFLINVKPLDQHQ